MGLEAEKAMLTATGGINTHKGQIFILGVALAASRRKSLGDGQALLREAGEICRGICDELTDRKEKGTHGEEIFRLYGSKGIRGEAEAGFPSVRFAALPRWKELLDKDCTMEEAALETLMVLMTRVDDSTVLYRRGREGLNTMKTLAHRFLDRGGIRASGSRERLLRINRRFVSLNISPGGCADLLALTRFLILTEESRGYL